MAGPMVGSEGDSIECWENYTAGEVLVQGLAGQIHQQDVEAIIRAQKQMLQRFEKTNEMLSNCNALSASRYATAQQEFAKHSATLLHAKKDLDYIFKKIRSIRAKLEVMYPQSYAAVNDKLRQEEGIAESAVEATTGVVLSQSVGGASGSSQSERAASETNTLSSGIERLTCQDPSLSEENSSRDSRSAVEETPKDMRYGGGEQNRSENDEEFDKDYEDAIKSGKVRRISGKLHHVSSSDESTSSNKSSCSSTDS